jgi:hypothetical protein
LRVGQQSAKVDLSADVFTKDGVEQRLEKALACRDDVRWLMKHVGWVDSGAFGGCCDVVVAVAAAALAFNQSKRANGECKTSLNDSIWSVSSGGGLREKSP